MLKSTCNADKWARLSTRLEMTTDKSDTPVVSLRSHAPAAVLGAIRTDFFFDHLGCQVTPH